MISRSMAEFLSLMREQDIPYDDLSDHQRALFDEALRAGYLWEGTTRDMRLSLSLSEKGYTALISFEDEQQQQEDQQAEAEYQQGRRDANRNFLHCLGELGKLFFSASLSRLFSDPAGFIRAVQRIFHP